MGVVATAIGTLAMSFMQGKAQQNQAYAQAQQAAENAKLAAANERIAQQNAEAEGKRAEENARVEAENAERQRRKAAEYKAAQRARIGASGITATGSAANALSDTQTEIDEETRMALWGGKQRTNEIYNRQNDYTNAANQYRYQSDVYNANAKAYKKAGKTAFMSSMLMGGLGAGMTLASGLYGAGSAAKAASDSGSWLGVGKKMYGFGSSKNLVGWGLK